jgi:hypothetical protein
MNDISFANIAVVSCGTLIMELNYLKKDRLKSLIVEQVQQLHST